MRQAVATLLVLSACSASMPGGDDGDDDSSDTGNGYALRVNQVGYATAAPKPAYLITPVDHAGGPFRVVDEASGAVVHRGTIGATASWSATMPFVYAIDFADFTTPGTYHLAAGDAKSPVFQIDSGAAVYGPAIDATLQFFRAQRDGSDVDGSILARRPSHLLDATAKLYKTPAFDSDGALKGTLSQLGTATRDVSGGWFDAGDYLKFVETASYTDLLMLLAADAAPQADLLVEARRGLEWLLKMWDDGTSTLYYQVGIGDGNDNVLGDHDVWRLPEDDDANAAPAGDPAFFVSHRPVLRAAAAGAKISPNLAGRLAAAFAIGARVYAADATFSAQCLTAAEHIFDLADVGATTLLTAAPFDFYGETSSRDDLELGATELYFTVAAGGLPSGLPHTDAAFYLAAAATHAAALDDTDEPLNLYEVGALAHARLAKALAAAGDPSLAISRADLTALVEAHLATAETTADPFGFAVPPETGDPVPHALGLAIEAWELDALAGSQAHEALAARQLAWVLGANAWGTTFVIGLGTLSPHCPQHQIANLVGSLDGTGATLVGATVDGPATADDLAGLTDPDGANACANATFQPFDGATSLYRDAVADYPTVEPADDYTATALAAFAHAARL